MIFSFFQIPWFFHAWNFFLWFSRFSRFSSARGNPALYAIIHYVHLSKIDQVKNAVNLSKIIFSAFNFFMPIFNMYAKHQTDTLNGLGEVDFTKYAL